MAILQKWCVKDSAQLGRWAAGILAKNWKKG